MKASGPISATRKGRGLSLASPNNLGKPKVANSKAFGMSVVVEGLVGYLDFGFHS